MNPPAVQAEAMETVKTPRLVEVAWRIDDRAGTGKAGAWVSFFNGDLQNKLTNSLTNQLTN